MVAWLEKWKAFCKGRGRTTWIVLMGMAGMLLIFLSGFIGGEDTESQKSRTGLSVCSRRNMPIRLLWNRN